jgi:putative membrane protein
MTGQRALVHVQDVGKGIMYRIFAIAAVALGLAVTPAVASGEHGKTGTGVGHEADAPRPIAAEEFLNRAAAGNRFEIVTGRLAQERAESARIKALGEEFVRDHTRLLEKGAAVAAELGITVKDELTPKQARVVERLERLSGEDFDRAWVRAQLDAHREALALNLRGAIRGERPEIRELAQGALPVVTHHYGQLLDIAADDDSGDDHGD